MVYVLMAVLGLGACAYTVARSKDRAGLLSVYLVAWGLVAMAEWWAYGVVGLYRYHTMLSPNWRHDSAWGVFLGEFVFLPSLNVVLVAYTNLWVGTAIGTAIVVALEAIYVPLGLFIYQGWLLWFTIVTFPFYFLAIHLYWRLVRRRSMRDGLLQALTRLAAMTGLVTHMSLMIWASQVTETAVRLVPTLEGNRSLMRMMVHGAGVLMGCWAASPAHWSDRWGRIALTVAGMIVINDAFHALGLLVFLRPMSGVLDAAGIGVITILVGVITDWVFHLAGVRRKRRIPAWEPPKT